MIALLATETVAVGIRIAVYLDLLLLAGLILCGGRVVAARPSPGWIAALACLGMLLTVMQFGATATAMTGGDASALDAELVQFLAFETAMGVSAIVRAAALLLLATLAGTDIARWPVGRLLPRVAAATALATLAWTGHAGASEGGTGIVHRLSDIAHLLAATLWLGALLWFLVILLTRTASRTDIAAALQRFSRAGTAIVIILVVSGGINLWAIAGWDALRDPLGTDYGRVLAGKLCLFAAMLVIAARNRWRLTPRLEHGVPGAEAALRRSIALETLAGLGVIVAVALLGTLSPTG